MQNQNDKHLKKEIPLVKKSTNYYVKIINDLHTYFLDQTVKHTIQISSEKKITGVEVWVEFHTELSRIANTFFDWLDQSIASNELCNLLPSPFLNYIRLYVDQKDFVRFSSKNYRRLWQETTRNYDLIKLHKFIDSCEFNN